MGDWHWDLGETVTISEANVGARFLGTVVPPQISWTRSGPSSCDIAKVPIISALPTGGAMLGDVDPACLGPALQELSLVGMRRAVGKSADLDRPLMTIELDRQ